MDVARRISWTQPTSAATDPANASTASPPRLRGLLSEASATNQQLTSVLESANVALHDSSRMDMLLQQLDAHRVRAPNPIFSYLKPPPNCIH